MKERPEALICEDFFEGEEGKNVLLSVKAPAALVEALKRKAEESGQEFPGFIRSALAFHVLPDALREMASEGPLDEDDKNALQEVQEYCQSILEMCEGVETIKRHALGLKKLSKEMEALVESKISKKLDKTLVEMRNDLERHEAERARKTKLRKLAGLESPGDPIQLSEAEKSNLTASQRRSRLIAGMGD